VKVTKTLRDVLVRRRKGPDGKDHKPHGYVFGNEVGEQIGSIKTAWRNTCRRAQINRNASSRGPHCLSALVRT
jgi:hypothetical protein